MTQEANSDELATFVTSTLKAIAAAIEAAHDVRIASAHGTGVSGYAAPETVEFDIAVSAKSASSSGGGLKIAVFGIGGDAKINAGDEQSTVSRIKFSIPTRFKKTLTPTPSIPSTVTAFQGNG